VRNFAPVVLGALLFFTACQKRESSATRVDPALATLIPSDTAILVGAKLDRLRQTPTYQKHFSQMSMPRLDDFAKETGLDPRRDVWDVLFCSNGSNSGVLMLRGKFAPGELEPKLEREGAARTRYKSYSLFGDERNSVFFMNASTALAGTTAALKGIIDSLDRPSPGIPATLRPLVDAVPNGSQFWAVFTGSAITLPFSTRGGFGLDQILRSVESGRFSANLTNGFDFQASGTCTNDQSAKQIHDLLKGLVGIGRLSTSTDQADLLKVYDSINVEQQGRVVNVSADIAQDIVDKFVDTFVVRRKPV
jgi:hypothetical protein